MSTDPQSLRATPIRDLDSEANSSAVLVPKLLARYGDEIATLHRLGDELERTFARLFKVEDDLRPHGISGMSRGLSEPINAALTRWDPAEAPVG